MTAERDALATEIDRLEYCLRNSVGDACNLDTECRKAARSVLGDVVDGTEYGVPTLLDVVALVVALARNVTVERDELVDRCDLMVDEFQRIASLAYNSEISGLCTRAINGTRQLVPVIQQRNNAIAERDEALKQGLSLTLLVDELREELALAQNALAQAH